tara:strand:+ start:987 stop:1409 length:423 start_codon:yes stop_codon:yes gene_type:complete
MIDKLKTNESVISEFQIVNIHQIPKIPVYVKAVPSILVNRNDIITGKDAFDFVTKLVSPPDDNPNAFECGFGSGNYSFIESEGLIESQRRFTYIEENGDTPLIPENTSIALEESKSSTGNLMEQIMEQRRMEIPQFSART